MDDYKPERMLGATIWLAVAVLIGIILAWNLP